MPQFISPYLYSYQNAYLPFITRLAISSPKRSLSWFQEILIGAAEKHTSHRHTRPTLSLLPQTFSSKSTHSIQPQNHLRIPTQMCVVFYFRAHPCNHRWFTIGHPCGKNAGFANCPMLRTGRIVHPGPTHRVETNACPQCGMKGDYDRNLIRMVQYEGPGYKWILNAKDPAKAARDGEGRPDGMICCELM